MITFTLKSFLIFACYLYLTGTCFASKPTLFVSIVPQKYFVQQISGDLVEVKVMVKPGANPATYEPKPSQMAGLAESKAYFCVGVPFESVWLERIQGVNPQMEIVHTDKDIKKRMMESHHNHVHDEKKENEHGAGEHGDEHAEERSLDPHTWLAPLLVKKQAAVIFTALKKMLPEHIALLDKNYNNFLTRLDNLDVELRRIFAGQQGLEFMVFHPSWGYFAEAYGLIQEPVEIEGKSPKPSQLRDLILNARQKRISTIFVQPQFSEKSAKVIARELGGEVVYADPLAADWEANLLNVASKIKKSTQ